MRKYVSITLAVLFLAVVVSGFAEGHIHPGSAGHHTVISVLFLIMICAHVTINFKAFARYFKGTVKSPAAK